MTNPEPFDALTALERALPPILQMGEDTAGRLGDTLDDPDGLVTEVERDPAAMAAYVDAGRRAATVQELTAARNRRKLSQEAVAELMGTSQPAVSDLENLRTDPKLSTLQRYARACGYRVCISLIGTTVTHFSDSDDSSAAAESSHQGAASETGFDLFDFDELEDEVDSDPLAKAAYQDARLRSQIIQELVEARKIQGQSQGKIGSFVGMRQPAISDLERGAVDPRLATLQRYARACSLLLDVIVVSDNALGGITGIIAPSVDETAADLAVVDSVRHTASTVVGSVLRDVLRIESAPHVPVGEAVPLELALPTHSAWSEILTARTMKGLITQGWLNYHPATGDTAPRQLKVNQRAASFFGISIRDNHVRGLVTGLDPTKAESHQLQRIPLSSTDPETVVDTVVELFESLARTSPDPLGVGVELSGPVDRNSGKVLFAPDLQMHTTRSWEGYPLEAKIQSRINNVRTVVTNDASALALREHLTRGSDGGLVLVYLSESTRGIGCGLVFNGGLVAGAGGVSGEIGHVVIDGSEVECDRCRRGRRGCLEMVASGQAIARGVGAEDLASAANLATKHNRGVADAFAAAGYLLGKVLGDLVTVMNPRDLAICGPRELVDEKMASARHFSDAVSRGLKEKSLSDYGSPRLVALQDWTCPSAAAAAAVNDFLGRPLEYAPDMVAKSQHSDLALAAAR